MKENETPVIRRCPRCDEAYGRPPSLSRTDGETLICPDCGIREALESIGIYSEEQDKIVDIIHGYTQGM